MAFLTTSLEDCLKNVQKRRDLRADTRVYDPSNTISKFTSIMRSKPKMLEEKKVRVEDLDPNTGVEQVISWLKEAV
ncbi:MAG TPA: hypothetical protein VHC20_01285, partial [Candidatus Paceibacterota bacterium]|nr:hypothetical protein [Candidatus Paceibacterota bacterium]